APPGRARQPQARARTGPRVSRPAPQPALGTRHARRPAARHEEPRDAPHLASRRGPVLGRPRRGHVRAPRPRLRGRLLAVPGLTIRGLDPEADLDVAVALLDAELGGRLQARRGELVDALEGPALVAVLDARIIGVV